ncbi:MAG: acetate--CoA ligase family protein [Longimicrobiales bacterium]|nr:acetate--CoA ligase family protein [Longimicrobiales bacterium]
MPEVGSASAGSAHHPLTPVFAPRSVAVVGASADPGKRGYQILRALAESGYRGAVYPVNPRGGTLLGLPVHPSIAALPEAPDLAVVCTPAATAPDVVAACGARGIPAAVILAVGFGEAGTEGAALEARVREAARRGGVRVVGPNTSGLLNLPLGLNLIGARGVRSGGLSLLVQSGNMALALMNEATDASRAGVALCCGLGNEADVGFGEALGYLGAHEATRAILCYAEGMRDARGFLEAAAGVARTKPVVLLKAGRSAEGAVAARSHTGAVAGPYERLRAGMAQAGVVEVLRTDEMLQVGAALAWQPPARPESAVAILSDGGGQATLAVDALSELSVPLARLGPETRSSLRALLGPAAAVGNPVDLAGAADQDPGVFARALDLLVRDGSVGTVLVVGLFGGYGIRFAESLAAGEETAAHQMAALAARAGVGLVVHSMYAPHWTPALEALGAAHVPVVASLDVACRAVAEVWRRGRLLETEPWSPAPGGAGASGTGRRVGVGKAEPDPDAAIVRARREGRTVLTEPEARALLARAGLVYLPAELCRTPGEALRAARRWAEPLALKVVSDRIPHKSDAGGVALGVSGEAAVCRTFSDILDRARAHLEGQDLPGEVEGVLISPMQPPPLVELLVGACRDPDVGPVLSMGAGGVWVEALADVAHRVLPVDDAAVRAQLQELRVAGMLAGGRGRPRADVEAVVRAARAVARCLLENPDVAEVEVNPLFVHASGAVPVDARVYLTATPSS